MNQTMLLQSVKATMEQNGIGFGKANTKNNTTGGSIFSEILGLKTSGLESANPHRQPMMQSIMNLTSPKMQEAKARMFAKQDTLDDQRDAAQEVSDRSDDRKLQKSKAPTKTGKTDKTSNQKDDQNQGTEDVEENAKVKEIKNRMAMISEILGIPGSQVKELLDNLGLDENSLSNPDGLDSFVDTLSQKLQLGKESTMDLKHLLHQVESALSELQETEKSQNQQINFDKVLDQKNNSQDASKASSDKSDKNSLMKNQEKDGTLTAHMTNTAQNSKEMEVVDTTKKAGNVGDESQKIENVMDHLAKRIDEILNQKQNNQDAMKDQASLHAEKIQLNLKREEFSKERIEAMKPGEKGLPLAPLENVMMKGSTTSCESNKGFDFTGNNKESQVKAQIGGISEKRDETNFQDSLKGVSASANNETTRANNLGKTQVKPEVITGRDIIHQVVEKAKVVIGPEKSEMLMELKPEHLGKLSLKVVTENGIVLAKIATENEQAKVIIDNNMQQLKDALEKQGIVIQDVRVSVGQEGRKEFSQKDNKNTDRSGSKQDRSIGVQRRSGVYQNQGMDRPTILSRNLEGSQINLTA